MKRRARNGGGAASANEAIIPLISSPKISGEGSG